MYDAMAARKSKPKDFEPYAGDNGRVNRCVQIIKNGKIKRGGWLLDVGGSIGDLAYQVKNDKLFDDAVVLDISEKSCEAARSKGCRTIVCDIDKQGIVWSGNPLFDVVTALDFIEHIVDPVNFARECFRVLNKGGEVFINTPNIRFWKHIHELWFTGRFPHTSGDKEVFHGGHLAFYTSQDLREIFGQAGFTGFEVFKDDEGYESPPQLYVDPFKPKTQAEYVNISMELGCPNLLFKAVKP